MRYIALSHWLLDKSPVHIGLKKPEITPNSQISGGDGYNSYMINVENHSGTHIDAPGHFLENGKIISDYLPDDLIFNHPLILDIPKGQNEFIELQDMVDVNLNGVNSLFFSTGFEKYRCNDPGKYLTENPGISPDVVYWIRKNFNGIRCIGIDCVSISCFKSPELGRKAHLNAFKKYRNLGEPLLLIEDMKLGEIGNEDIESVIVSPWQVMGIDSAPCTVLGKIK